MLWSGCLGPESATLTPTQISNPTGGAYRVDIPPGYTAIALPEYLPHVPFTREWLETDQGAAFTDIPVQPLEQKLRADHLLYRRPNYRAYFSISGEDILLLPEGQTDDPAPSPFLVFTVNHTRSAGDGSGLPALRQGTINAFGEWAAGSLREQASDVSTETRTILGRKWLWLTARLSYPLSPMDGFLPGEVSASPIPESDVLPPAAPSPTDLTVRPVSSTDSAPELWYFLYAATLDGSGNLYGIQGWARSSSDLRSMIDAVGDMIGTLRTGTSAIGD